MFEEQRLKAWIYPRVSSDDQAERETIQNQVEYALKYCELNNIEILDWFKDDGISGTIPFAERPEGGRLMKLLESGEKPDLVLIYNLKRLGRKTKVILNAVEDIEKYGVTIRSMTEAFDTSTPAGRFTLTILAGVADLDRETTLENMQLGTDRHARLGNWLGGIVPFGYTVIDKKLIINENPLPGFTMSEADIIRLIYKMTADDGDSCVTIARLLNAMGIPPSYVKDNRVIKKGKRKGKTAGFWRPARIRNMIVSTTYKGLHIYGKRSTKKRDLIMREVPPIVTEEKWAKAQKVLSKNRLEGLSHPKRDYLLIGLIKCGICGLNFSGVAYKNKSKNAKPDDKSAFYRCNGKQSFRGPLQGKCDSRNVPAEWLENYIWGKCVEFIKNPGAIITELKKPLENLSAIFEQKQMLEKSLLKHDDQRERILDLYRAKLIEPVEVEKQLQKIAQEKEAVKGLMHDLNMKIENQKNLIKAIDESDTILAQLRDEIDQEITFELKRKIVQILVEDITVNPGEDPTKEVQLVINYRFTSSVTRTVSGSYHELGFSFTLIMAKKGRFLVPVVF